MKSWTHNMQVEPESQSKKANKKKPCRKYSSNLAKLWLCTLFPPLVVLCHFGWKVDSMGGWLLWVWSVWKGCFVYSVQFFLCDGGAVAKGKHSSMRTSKAFVASRDLIKINLLNTSFEWPLCSFPETSQGCCWLSALATVNMYWYQPFDPSQKSLPDCFISLTDCNKHRRVWPTRLALHYHYWKVQSRIIVGSFVLAIKSTTLWRHPPKIVRLNITSVIPANKFSPNGLANTF